MGGKEAVENDRQTEQSNPLKQWFPYAYEDKRLETFKNWPHEQPTKYAMAEAGFYFLGHPVMDRVGCFYCNGLFEAWEPTDNPLLKHKRLSPNCPVFGVKMHRVN